MTDKEMIAEIQGYLYSHEEFDHIGAIQFLLDYIEDMELPRRPVYVTYVVKNPFSWLLGRLKR